jgi:WD40 repeat protein
VEWWPDGTALLTAGVDGTARVWHSRQGRSPAASAVEVSRISGLALDVQLGQLVVRKDISLTQPVEGWLCGSKAALDPRWCAVVGWQAMCSSVKRMAQEGAAG